MPKLRGGRSGFTLVEVVTVAIIISVMGYLSVSNFRGMQDRSNNAAVESNVKTITLALEKYRSDQTMLPTGGLIGGNDFTTTPNTPKTYLLDTTSLHLYLPNNFLPADPFAPCTQNNELTYPVSDPNYVTATQVSSTGASVRKAGNLLGPGHLPMTGSAVSTGVVLNFDLATYGAVTYSVNGNRLARPAPTGNSDTYVLVGIGKKGQQAIIAAETTNAN